MVAVIALIIAGWQLREARQKRIEAQEAANKAKEAEENTRKLASQADFTFTVIEALNDSRPAYSRSYESSLWTIPIASTRARKALSKVSCCI
jgi:hypothetical protein